MKVTRVSAAETHEVRRRVLRADLPDSSVSFPGDDDAGAVHLAAWSGDGGGDGDGGEGGDEVVGVASFFPSPYEGRPDAPAWQLRGMAVVPAVQGQGVGSALLAEGVVAARAAGAAVLWANGRDSAVGFYERHGWKVVGDGFVYGPARLPHHVVLVDL
ncbi:MAG TPA: GNAT family N-acetyltransferase [Acidimicrobiales bacterium]|nr:GNAT family N-acetyltransferase [Acidimicrobiales bacterium]